MSRPIDHMMTTTQILVGVSKGIVSQEEAKTALHADTWAEVLNALADRGFPPPRPSPEDVEAELEEAMPLMKAMEASIHGN